MDLDMDTIREQMAQRKRLDKIKYRAWRFAFDDLAPKWEGDDYSETDDDLADWLNRAAADGFAYRDALPTGDGFVIVVEKKDIR